MAHSRPIITRPAEVRIPDRVRWMVYGLCLLIAVGLSLLEHR